MTNVLCLRVTQVAQLKSSDFTVKRGIMYIAKFKKHEELNKKLTPSGRKLMQKFHKSPVFAKPITSIFLGWFLSIF